LDELPAYLAAARPQGNGRTWTTPSFLQFQRIHRNYRRLRQRTTA